MPRLILLIAIGLIGWIVYQRLKGIPPGKRKAEYLKVGLVALAVVVVLLTVTGRMHWIGAAITGLLVALRGLLPALVRALPILQWFHRQKSSATGASGGQQSTVETGLLRMTLDHDSGEMNGEVLEGEFAGCRLDEMERADLDQLMAWCCQRDPDSARLLDSYLQRRFGDSTGRQQAPPSGGGGAMSQREALAVLGLAEGASRDDIVASHRKLMQKLHPDRGGNDYLAAKLNQAKDTLLG